MIKIAIVEDNSEEMQTMRSYVDRCSKEQNFTCTIDLYTDGDEIVESMRAGYDLIILDIELPLMNGMDAAEQIRKVDRDATIIFTTHNPNYAIRGYKVQGARADRAVRVHRPVLGHLAQDGAEQLHDLCGSGVLRAQ